MVGYGVESGSQKILDILKKNTTIEQAKHAIGLTKKYGIKTKGYFMVGCPGETEKTLQETVSFILRVPLDVVTIACFTPFPGTLDYSRARDYGSFNEDWTLLTQHKITFVPKDLTTRQIEDAIREIVYKFYFRPKIIVSYIGSLVNPRKTPLLTKGLLTVLRFLSANRRENLKRYEK
jgi:anaerobic magnesium-protoporphyrin IX monomethyl ester cyclase